MNQSNKQMIKCGLGIISLIASVVLLSYVGVLIYKKCKASNLLEEANKNLNELREVIDHSRSCIKNNEFLMTGPAEIDPLIKEVEVVDEKLVAVDAALLAIKSKHSVGDIDEVNESLEGDVSPIKRAAGLTNHLRNNVIKYCNEKRNNRDAVVSNEWFLKARLKKPIDPAMTERTEDIQGIPDKFFAMIPRATDEVLKGLSSLSTEAGGVCDPRLFNSLGDNLFRHKPTLEHIQKFGKTDAIKTRASDMYCKAMDHYLKVRDENDKISVWYRGEKNDGKYSMDAYKKLLAEQEIPLNDIHQGDNLLRALAGYLNELHEQYYVYVSSHRKKSTEFSHTRPVTSVDSKGNTHIDLETYYTDGYKYYYTLTTVRPNSKSEQEIYVGEIDSTWREWDYSREEKVGWVRKWKRLHEDNTMIKRGWVKDLTPIIEAE